MRTLLLALVLILAAVPAHAQSDLDVVTSVVPPNVMILLDNSGSMAHAMWPDDFDPGLFHDIGSVVSECNIGPLPAIDASDGFCPGSGDALDRCPDNGSRRRSGQDVTCASGVISGGCAAAPVGWSCSLSGGRYEFELPDITSGGSTSWSRNYLSWLFQEIIDGNTPTIPMVDRIDTARNALLELIDLINPAGLRENVRFGLTNFAAGVTQTAG